MVNCVNHSCSSLIKIFTHPVHTFHNGLHPLFQISFKPLSTIPVGHHSWPHALIAQHGFRVDRQACGKSGSYPFPVPIPCQHLAHHCQSEGEYTFGLSIGMAVDCHPFELPLVHKLFQYSLRIKFLAPRISCLQL